MTADFPPSFEISLEYLAPGNTEVESIPSTGGGDEGVNHGELLHHPVAMHNGREREFDLDRELEPLPALRRCRDLVLERPLLRPFYDQLIACRIEYAKMQAAGTGVR